MGIHLKVGDRSNIVRGNLIHDCSIGITQGGSITDDDSTLWPAGDVDIYENIIYNTAEAGIMIRANASDVRIHNNSIFGESDGAGIKVYPFTPDVISNLTSYNNIAVNAGDHGHYQEWTTKSDDHTGLDSDYNIFFDGDLSEVVVWNCDLNYESCADRTYTLDEYKPVSGLDAHSLQVDPLFTDSAHRDFHLLDTSPAIDAGKAVSGYHCEESDDINPEQTNCRHWKGEAPDIGAYELGLDDIHIGVIDYQL
jgi:hypothetical protein